MSVNANFNIDGVISQINLKINQQLEKSGSMIESSAKSQAPVDTGRLRDSITHSLDAADNSVEIGSNVEYAPYVEYRKSFLKAAADKDKSNILKLFENIF